MTSSTRRVAVVTAAANGIGAAVATRLAAAGRDLGILDIDGEGLERVARTARGHGVKVVAQVRDVRNGNDVAQAFASFRAELGPIDILTNIVGGSLPSRPVEDITDEEWDGVLTLNLRGLFNCTRAVVPEMKSRRWGR